MTEKDFEEIKKVHGLVAKLWTGPPMMRPTPEDADLIDKWAPFDVTGALIDEVARLKHRVAELEGAKNGL